MNDFTAATIAIVLVIVGVLGMALLMAFPVMLAWNYVIPDVFGLRSLDFWQSFALMVVANSLVRSSAGGSK